MVNEFVLDDLSSSWTDSIYKNKSNSKLLELAPVSGWSKLALGQTLRQHSVQCTPVWYLEEIQV